MDYRQINEISKNILLRYYSTLSKPKVPPYSRQAIPGVEGKRTPEVSYTQVYYEFRHFVAKFIVHLGVTFCKISRCTNNVKRAAAFIVHLDLTPRRATHQR